jgi:hypothetical protein
MSFSYSPPAAIPPALTVCGNGYGGAFVTGATPTASGCAICPAGTFGSQLSQSTACKSCASVGGVSPQAGASACQNCTATQVPNANGTACISGE